MSRPFWQAPVPNTSHRCIRINAGRTQHLYPIAYFRRLARGDAVEPPPPEVLAVIIRDWLERLGVEP